MWSVIISASFVFISTSIDYFILFITMFGRIESKQKAREIYIGHFLGIALLIALSLFVAYVLNFIPETWMVGLLGLFPIYYGLQIALGTKEPAEEQVETVMQDAWPLWLDVFILTVTLSGDNFGIYPPYFLLLSWNERVLAIIIFSIGVFILCKMSEVTANISWVRENIMKYEKVIVPLTLFALGFFILWNSGTIEFVYNLFISLLVCVK